MRDRFDPSTPDHEWLRDLSQEREWVVISGDVRIYKTPQLQKVWRSAQLTTFFLQPAWERQKFWEQAWKLDRKSVV